MTIKLKVRGRDNYWRYTLYCWFIEVRDILERELGDQVEVVVEDGDSDDPEILLDDVLIGSGVPGEEGYLIEIVKKAYYLAKSRDKPLS